MKDVVYQYNTTYELFGQTGKSTSLHQYIDRPGEQTLQMFVASYPTTTIWHHRQRADANNTTVIPQAAMLLAP